ncbi:MAG: hypothetical protein E2581_08715 [Pseudomonas sp.]|uniref:hypothetical protein n=1 Tax=Pseudomonas sp. TaxID=306 RepID=UPI001D73792A|nr:hypothetical protein [Pseudomonas sp.]MPS98568.1 hypothetical protein [Pseudomonas sp.]
MFDAAKAAAHPAVAEALILQQQERLGIATGALNKIIEMNQQWAADQWGDAGRAENMACVRTAREALAALAQQPQALQHCADAI